MDFNRKELIAKLRKVKQARLARAREYDKRALATCTTQVQSSACAGSM